MHLLSSFPFPSGISKPVLPSGGKLRSVGKGRPLVLSSGSWYRSLCMGCRCQFSPKRCMAKKIKKIKKNHTGKNWCISYCLGPLNVFNNYYIYSILTVNKINIEISQSMGLRLCCCCCENVLLFRRDVRPENERLIRNNNEQWVA